MRIASYTTVQGPSFGIVTADGIVDLGRRTPYADISAALAAGALPELARHAGVPPDFALGDVMLLPSVPSQLRKVLCVGLNYHRSCPQLGGSRASMGNRCRARHALGLGRVHVQFVRMDDPDAGVLPGVVLGYLVLRLFVLRHFSDATPRWPAPFRESSSRQSGSCDSAHPCSLRSA